MLEQPSLDGDMPLTAHLSARERDVLALAAQGMTNQQIASQLAVTVHGVKFHLASIFRKFGVENRTAAVAVYLGATTPHLD